VDYYNDVALEFNAKLGWLVTKLNKELHGFQLVDANAYNMLLQIVTHPSQFGKFFFLSYSLFDTPSIPKYK
jgi:hypothetical protein